MHAEAKHFLDWVTRVFNTKKSQKVLDVGSGDINGNNRDMFDSGAEYCGNDVAPGPNVTIVCKTSALDFADEAFDTIVSSECFEHDPEYAESMKNITRMLKPGGLFAFTCASTGRPEHGTRRSESWASLATKASIQGWSDHYKNLTFADVAAAIDLSAFSSYQAYYNSKSKDLYFWGVKHGGEPIDAVYEAVHVTLCS